MAFLCDDLLLSPLYSSLAEGGPEFSSVLISSGEGGGTVYAAEAREDFIGKWSIEYALLSTARRQELRSFAILRKGMARAFRFLAPDDREIENEVVGRLNATTGEIERLTTTNGTDARFFVCKYYADSFNSYLRWLTKPSPLDDLSLELLDSDGETVLASASFPGGYGSQGQLVQGRAVTLGVYGQVSIYYRYGILLFDDPPPAGKVIRVSSGIYHHPVHFSSDWLKFSVDDGDLSAFKVELEELLPVSLGMMPDIELGAIPDEDPPTFSITSTSSNSSSITVDYTTSDNLGVELVELEIDIVE